MVGAAGIEPATAGLEIRCSIRLSYAPSCRDYSTRSRGYPKRAPPGRIDRNWGQSGEKDGGRYRIRTYPHSVFSITCETRVATKIPQGNRTEQLLDTSWTLRSPAYPHALRRPFDAIIPTAFAKCETFFRLHTIARVAIENYQKRRDHGQGIAVVQSWLKLASREDLNVLPDRLSDKKTTNL
jgi:hypothetical protein